MTFLASLWARLGGYLAAISAGIAFLFAFWWKARQDGKATMQAEQDRHRAEAIAAKRKSDSEIDDLGHADLDQRFGRWLRR